MTQSTDLFDPGFLTYLKTFVDVHHSLYPTVPPQGIYSGFHVSREQAPGSAGLRPAAGGTPTPPALPTRRGDRLPIGAQSALSYQSIDIPIPLLRLLGGSDPQPAGKRIGRRSLGADVIRDGKVIFHVRFEVQTGNARSGLRVENCKTLIEWEKLRERTIVVPTAEDPGI